MWANNIHNKPDNVHATIHFESDIPRFKRQNEAFVGMSNE